MGNLLVGAALSTAKAVIYSIPHPDFAVSSGGRSIENCQDTSNIFNLSSSSSSILSLDSNALDFKEIASIHLAEEGLFLSFDWHNDNKSADALLKNKFSVSTQASSIISFQLREDGQIEEFSRFSNCHTLFGESLPAWTVFSAPFNPYVLASGGDDSVCKLWVSDFTCFERQQSKTNCLFYYHFTIFYIYIYISYTIVLDVELQSHFLFRRNK